MNNFASALADFLKSIDRDTHAFATTLAFINEWYDFTPTAFRNGNVTNAAEQNQGSCRVLAFALMNMLSSEQALKCFGEHYREVLATPDVDKHHNLRRLQKEGLTDIHFEGVPLTPKHEP